VFGAAPDGGYWALIGLENAPAPFPPRLFENVRWFDGTCAGRYCSHAARYSPPLQSVATLRTGMQFGRFAHDEAGCAVLPRKHEAKIPFQSPRSLNGSPKTPLWPPSVISLKAFGIKGAAGLTLKTRAERLEAEVSNLKSAKRSYQDPGTVAGPVSRCCRLRPR